MRLLIGGLTLGSVYALVAIGIVLIYKSTDVVNFAQGEVLMVGAYTYILISDLTGSAAFQMGAAMTAGALTGLLFFVVTHFLLRKAGHIATVIGTLALFILMHAGARQLFTDNPRRAEPWLLGSRLVEVGGAIFSANSFVTLGVMLIVGLALYAWFKKASYGKAMLAVAENQYTSALAGLPVRTLLAGSWVIGGALAAVAGVLLAPTIGVYPTMGGSVLFAAFIAALLGGFKNILGSIVGGLLLGLIHTYGVVAIGGALRDVVTFGILIAVLLFRPTGLFGETQLREI